ncbi:MAG: rhodanese-like domain-containing protein [Gammaproteobacteria bacterium]
MDAPQLADYLLNSTPLLLDVREPWEFDICHLADSVNIPMGEIAQHLDQIAASEQCVVLCHHGVRSMHVIQYLQQQNIKHLINLDGGLDAWARQIDPDMALY